jgi:putative phosphoesterase
MIGIMADSHDNLHSIKRAVRIFKEAGCRLVVHAGDFVAPFAARELESLGCPVKAVFGNCDGEKQGLEKALHPFGEIKKSPMAFSYQDLNFLVMHVPARLDFHISSGKFDVVIFAHNHKPELSKKKKTLLINPGEAGGWLSGKSTVALLDPRILSAEIIALD